MDRTKTLVPFFIRSVISLTFIITGLLKVLAPSTFLEAIEGYQLVPYSIAFGMAFFLPWLEIVTGISLFIPSLSKGAAQILFLLVIIFIVALSVSWARGLDIQCGCFGANNSTTNYPLHITGNLFLLVGLYWLLRQSRSKRQA